MKRRDVELGGHYVARISGRMAVVRLDRESPHGGWDATNVVTGRSVWIRSAAKLRRPSSAEAGKWFAERRAFAKKWDRADPDPKGAAS